MDEKMASFMKKCPNSSLKEFDKIYRYTEGKPCIRCSKKKSCQIKVEMIGPEVSALKRKYGKENKNRP